MPLVITVNGKKQTVESSPDTPLLYVLRDEMQLDGPMFGCGLSQCGACAVLHGGKEIRACVYPVSAVSAEVTTLEGLPNLWARRRHDAKSVDLHPLQQAWIDEQVPQCGYCQSGMMIAAASFLERTPNPDDATIKKGMDSHLCRCGTQPRMVKAIARAAKTMRETV
jgi:aerobic-type carbon monoxide dehydrogenase small subunit (CoxS/CutS family)